MSCDSPTWCCMWCCMWCFNLLLPSPYTHHCNASDWWRIVLSARCRRLHAALCVPRACVAGRRADGGCMMVRTVAWPSALCMRQCVVLHGHTCCVPLALGAGARWRGRLIFHVQARLRAGPAYSPVLMRLACQSSCPRPPRGCTLSSGLGLSGASVMERSMHGANMPCAYSRHAGMHTVQQAYTWARHAGAAP